MKKYEKYKPTDSPWIGEIPEHWEVKRFRFVCNYKKGKNPKDLVYDFEDGMKPYLSMDYLRGTSNDTEYTFYEDGLIESKAGDLLLLWDGSNAGEFIISKDGFLSSTCALLSNRYESNAYFGYLCNVSEKYLKDMTNGMGIPHVDANVFKNLTAIIPPKAEQDAIVAYLGEKCGSIDKVIATQEKRVALLNELKQSVISEAVTRGINPDAPLKDTGIEWIGQIPEHWEVKKLKYIANLQSGDTISAEEFSEDGEYPVFGGNGQRGFIDKYNNDGNYVLIGRQGALCGNINYAHGRFFATEHAVVVYPYSEEDIIWVGELLRASNLNQYSVSAAQPGLAVSNIKNICYPYPPKEERILIGNKIKSIISRIDPIIAKALREIELLREYKQSIISEAVTGKIKVC